MIIELFSLRVTNIATRCRCLTTAKIPLIFSLHVVVYLLIRFSKMLVDTGRLGKISTLDFRLLSLPVLCNFFSSAKGPNLQ